MASPIDFNTAQTYARQFGDGTTYALDFEQNGQKYTFVPSNLAQNGGVTAGDNTYLLPYFTDQKNLDIFSKNSQKTDLSDTGLANYLKSQGQSTQGFLIPTDQANFDNSVNTQPTSTLGGSLTGLKKSGDEIVLGLSGGGGNRYITPTGEVHNPTITYSSILGDVFGSPGQTLANAWQDLGPIGQLVVAYYAGGAISDSMAGGAAGASGTGEALSGIDLGGAGGSPASWLNAGDFSGALPAGAAYVAPEVTTLGNVAGTTEGMLATPEVAGMGGAQGLTMPNGTNLAEMGGAQGLQSGVGTSLAEMGGAQGLTTAGAAGGVLGAAGLTAGSGATAAGIGTGLGLSPAASGTGSLLTGAAAGVPLAAGAGTLTGSALGDMAAINAGAGVVGGLISSNAAKEAAEVQAAAADRAIAQQQKNFETINAQQAPYRATGYNALNNIAGLTTGQTPQYDANGNIVRDANGNPVMTTGSGYLQHQFDANDLKSGLAPNYDFMLGQGQMANQRAANMGGGALGGNALQGLNKYTQDYAGNAYQNAFNNYQTQRGNIYNTLAGIAGIGQTGQAATNTASTNATNAITQLGVGAAGANAAGTVGSANAYTNAINNATNNYTLASLLNQRGNVQMPIG